MSWCVSPSIYPVWDSLCFLDLIDYFFSQIREVFNYNLFKYFLSLFLFLFFFWDPYNSNVGVFNVVPEVSETVLNSFHSFFFILLCSSYFYYFIFQVTYLFFVSVILLLIPSREFLISFIVLFITVCLLFSSSRSLLNVSCIFSILFPRFWVIFTIFILNCFSGRLPISSSFVRSGGFLPCSCTCYVFLFLLILHNLLCLGSHFLRLQVLSSHYVWCLPPVGKVGSVGCVGFLVEGTSACVLVNEAGSCLSGGQVHVWWCVLGCLWPYFDFRQPLC